MDHTTALALSCLCVICVMARHWRRSEGMDGLQYPPGPVARIPWIGNAFQIPAGTPWLTFMEWCKEYGMCYSSSRSLASSIVSGLGDIISVESFGQRIVILGSYKACVDLLERRSGNYSDRPHVPMLTEL